MIKLLTNNSKKVLAASLAALFLSVPFTGVAAAASHDKRQAPPHRQEQRVDRHNGPTRHDKDRMNRDKQRRHDQQQMKRDKERREHQDRMRHDKERRDRHERDHRYEHRDNGKRKDVGKRNRNIATGLVIGGILGAIIANNS